MSYTLTPLQSAQRYIAGEIVIIQRHLDLGDLSPGEAMRKAWAAVGEARVMFLRTEPTARVEVCIDRQGRISFSL